MRGKPNNKLRLLVKEHERKLIYDALKAHGWNVAQTAKYFGFAPTNFYKKLREHKFKRFLEVEAENLYAHFVKHGTPFRKEPEDGESDNRLQENQGPQDPRIHP